MPRRFLTLVGATQAKVGFKFIHYGFAESCLSCQLRKVCIENLEPGRIYEVVNVREMEHPCALHENGVRAVEVVLSPVQTALESKQAIKGATLTYKQVDCNLECSNVDLCKPTVLKSGDKCIVENVDGDIVCLIGKKLKIVLLRLVE